MKNNKKGPAKSGSYKSKYLTGSRVNYVDNPSTVLMENWKNSAEAQLAGERSFMGQTMDFLGPLFSQALQTYGMKGYKNSAAEHAKQQDIGFDIYGDSIDSWTGEEDDEYGIYATGGSVSHRDIEVEGQEMYELPTGEVGMFSGPSHENGGIDVTVPVGTDIYSKRIKGPDGKSMANRKKERTSLEERITKKLTKNPGDALSKRTAERMFLGIDLQEEQDLQVMQAEFNKQNATESYATGGPVNNTGIDYKDLWQQMYDRGVFDAEPTDLNTAVVSASKKVWEPAPPPEMPTEVTPKSKFDMLGLTAGDMLGTAGNILKANQAYEDTLGEISGSIPNVNSYENFGQKALGTLQGNQAMLQQMYDNQTRGLRSRTRTNMAQNRATARGVNTTRAGDLANIQAENQTQVQIDAANTQANIANNAAIAQQQNAIDQAVMTGEAQKRLADQQDYAQDRMNLQQGRQTMIDALTTQNAGVLNKAHGRKLMASLMSARYDNFEVDAYGNITPKAGIANLTTDQQINKAGLWDTYQDAKRQGIGVEFKNGNLYKTGTNTIFAPGQGGTYQHEVRNYRDLLDVGADLETTLGEKYVQKPQYEFGDLYSGLTAKDADLNSNLERYMLDNNIASLDLSKEDVVKSLQTALGMGKKADGKLGKGTVQALKDYKNTQEKLPGVINASSDEIKELFDMANRAGTVYADYEKYISDNLGDVDEGTFNTDKSLQEDIQNRSVFGAIQYADLNYDKERDTLGGLSKEEYRKALLVYPDLTSRDITQDIDLDMRVPGTTKTLGYLVQGNKYKGKRYIKR